MKRIALNCILWFATLAAAEWGAVGIFLVGLALSGVVTPLMSRDLNSQKDQLRRHELSYQQTTASPIARVDEAGARIDRFYSVLVPEDQVGRSVGKLFEIASLLGMKLEKADYRLATDKAGQYQTYQIDLPIRASYTAIQAFCDQVLTEFPFTSLDAVKFHRDKVSNVQIEATLRLTFFVALHEPRPSPSRSAPPSGPQLVSETAR